MTPRLALILAFLAPAAAQAETVRVYSGEHPGFSRLVLDFAETPGWSFGKVEGGYEFRPGREDVDYDLRRVWELIPRDRIAELSDLGDGRLKLDVDCACHADVFALASGEVVVDIASGDQDTAFDTPLPRWGAAPTLTVAGPRVSYSQARAGLPLMLPVAPLPGPATPSPSRQADPADAQAGDGHMSVEHGEDTQNTAADETSGHAVAGAPADPVPDHGDVEQMAQEHGAQDADPHGANPDPAAAPASDRVSETERALLDSIARAAAQGLVDADLSQIQRDVAAATLAPAEPPPLPEPERPVPSPVVAESHMSVQSSMDRAFAADTPTPSVTQSGDACIRPKYVDVTSWGGDMSDGADLGAYRSALLGEFDAANGDGVTALVRHYIYITFGAEALALIQHYPDAVDRPDLLTALAQIMDHGESVQAPQLYDQMACDSAVALWAVLAQPELRKGDAIDRSAVVLSFSGLPPHLRQHLGGWLAEKFLAIEDTATAKSIRGAMERAAPEPTNSTELLAARMEIAEGDHAAAVEKLDRIVSTGDALMPEALLARVEASFDSGEPLGDDIMPLIDSIRFELEGTDLGREATDAGIRGAIALDRFDEAFSRLEEATVELTPERIDLLRDVAYDAMAERGEIDAAFDRIEAGRDARELDTEQAVALDEVVFARLLAGGDEAEILRQGVTRMAAAKSLSRPSRRALAQAYLDLGFPRLVRDVLEGNGALPEPEDRRLFAAAALMDEKPEIAVGYLAGLDDEEAERMRAEAMAMARDHAGAVLAYGGLGDSEAELRQAVEGGMWADVARIDQGPLGEAARLAIGDPASQDPLPDTPIARSQVLVDTASSVRATLDALLADMPGQPVDETTQPAPDTTE